MKKLFLITFYVFLLSSSLASYAQKNYTVMFYNVENVFDTINQPDVRDEEFTPEGKNRWTGEKYWKKMSNLEKVFYSVAAEHRAYPTIIGVSEVENRSVLEDIVSLKKLQKANYQIAHFDSPDFRGIDVAFLYRPDQFKLEGSAPIKTVIPNEPNFRTRDILTMWGTIENEKFMFMVAHWPSRLGGQRASSYKRCAAAKIMRHIADSVRNENPEIKIVMMGDLNDDPTNESILKVLNAKGNVKDLVEGDLFNPFYQMIKDGHGTLAYRDAWNLFDNIIVSDNLIYSDKKDLKVVPSRKTKYYGHIYNRSFLFQKEGQFKGYPLRTYVGGNFQGGFSDHLPVFIHIKRTKSNK